MLNTSTTDQKEPHICIMMATYNGANFLAAQLDSIASQTHKNWTLIVSDDGSGDETMSILRHYQSRWGDERLQIRQGPKRGFCINFLSLATDTTLRADYYAFCDQDDVWMPNKLLASLESLCNLDSYIPALYCGRTTYFNGPLCCTNYSPLFPYPTSFRNAIVQSIAGGNTMFFNQASKSIIEQAGIVEVPSHDWWLYILLTGVGGWVQYDPVSYIYYRQHESSLIGGNTSLHSKLVRLIGLFNGKFRTWTDQNLCAVDGIKRLLSHENACIFSELLRLRRSTLLHRIRMIEICGLYRQTKMGSLSLILAAAFNKI